MSKKITKKQLQEQIEELKKQIESLSQTVIELQLRITNIPNAISYPIQQPTITWRGWSTHPTMCNHKYPPVWMGVGPALCELCGAPGPEPTKTTCDTIGTRGMTDFIIDKTLDPAPCLHKWVVFDTTSSPGLCVCKCRDCHAVLSTTITNSA